MITNENTKKDSIVNEIKQLLKRRWYFVIGALPFIIGFLGYCETGSDYLDAAFNSIRLYVLEYDGPQDGINDLIEIARWTAPIVTISGIAAILGNLLKRFRNRFLYRWCSLLNFIKRIVKIGRPYVTIAYFDDDNYEYQTLKKNLMKHDDTLKVKVIEMQDHIPMADLYILFGTDEENFDFYTEHIVKLEKYCRLNSRKEKNKLLSRAIVKSEFNWSKEDNSDYDRRSFKFDNKYILMRTETYSIKDEISDYINLVNLQELGAFKYWAYRWQGMFYKQNCYKEDLNQITTILLEKLYHNKLLEKNIDPSCVKDYVDYSAINSYGLNSFLDVDEDYVRQLCSVLNECNIQNIKKSFRFKKIKKIFKIKNNDIKEISSKVCCNLYEKIQKNMYITPDKFKNLKISIIGDNDMATFLLFTGLQLNIFHPEQKWTYNLFGDWNSFLNKHDQLTNNLYSENINSYDSDFSNNKNVLRESDLIIVCDDNKSSKIIDDLLLVTNGKKIDLISTKYDLFLRYKSNSNVNYFNYINEISNFEDFVEDNLNIDNVSKAYDYNPQSYKNTVTWEDFASSWSNQSSFFRYNYICREEFFEMIDDYINNECVNNEADGESINKDELEHIRMCRFYCYFNWKYGVPENGKDEDPEKKIHKMLLPYNQVT